MENSYSVGVPEIDAQHRNLLAIAAELYSAMAAGKGKDVMARTLARLVRYTEAHFAAEEKLMRKCSYPGLAAHVAQHVALTSQVKEFQKNFQSGARVLTVELLHFLSDWLVHHIEESDRAYAPFMQQTAVA